MRECGVHQTCGIDLFMTPERLLLLDTQPMLSASVIDHMIHHDKKYPSEVRLSKELLVDNLYNRVVPHVSVKQ